MKGRPVTRFELVESDAKRGAVLLVGSTNGQGVFKIPEGWCRKSLRRTEEAHWTAGAFFVTGHGGIGRETGSCAARRFYSLAERDRFSKSITNERTDKGNPAGPAFT